MQQSIMHLALILGIFCTIHQVNGQGTGVCHIYGDPHIISFLQPSQTSSNSYWCRLSGEHAILRNDYVEILATMRNGTWLIEKFNITFFDRGTTLCTITDHEQYCDSEAIRITRPSLTQLEIFYATPNLSISIVPQHYQYQWFDISIRMANEVVQQSTGLCVLPSVDRCAAENDIVQETNTYSMPRKICEIYLSLADQARSQLGLSNDPRIRNHTFAACIHDYQTTNSSDFGASLINVMVKDGIFKQPLDDLAFQFQTVSSIDIIHNAVGNASIHIATLFDTTTKQTSTTTSNSSTIRRAIQHVLSFPFFLLLYRSLHSF